MLMRNNQGQVLVEYLLMVMVALGLILTIQNGFRKSVFGVWSHLTQEVIGACPKGCLKDPRIR